jgi:hypothetical protein
VVPGPGAGAVAREAGVQISASAGAWRGFPRRLEVVVTPIMVTVDNGGAVPLRVRREQFALVAADGRQFAAHAPHEIRGAVLEPAPAALAYPRFSFGVGTVTRRGWGAGLGGPFGYDPFYYGDYFYPPDVHVELPTVNMLQQALPERVLAPGERVAGFLYFDRVPRKAGRVDFVARLVDGSTGQPIGVLAIPFDVK